MTSERAGAKDPTTAALSQPNPNELPCYILPVSEELCFDLEALLSAPAELSVPNELLLSAQPERVGDADWATCAKERVCRSTVTTELS